jgi:DNA-binding winged helix-turn-helix (wHTH) protein
MNTLLPREHSLKLGESVMGSLGTQIPTAQRPYLIGVRGHMKPAERHESQIAFVVLISNALDSVSGVGKDSGTDLKVGVVPYEIVDQILSILRQVGFPEARSNGIVERGVIRLNISSRLVTAGACRLTLTSLQFDLLEVLMQTPGRVLTRQYLTRTVLKKKLMPYDRCLDVHVSNLRKKLRAATGENCIETIRGVGYLFVCHLPEEQSSRKNLDCTSPVVKR